MGVGYEFYGLGIDLVRFGDVKAREKLQEKPRNLGLRRCAAAGVFRAAAWGLCLVCAAAQGCGALAQGKFQGVILGDFRPLLRGFGGRLRGIVLRF